LIASLRERWWSWNRRFERPRVRIAASILCVVAVLGGMTPFFVASFALQGKRDAIESVVREANLKDRDPVSVALLERGEVATPLGKFDSARLRSMGADLFDRQGKVLDPGLISDVLLAPQYPAWAPAFLVERPTSPLALTALLTGSSLLAISLGVFPAYLVVMAVAAAVIVPAVARGYFSVAFVATGITALLLSFALLVRLLIALLGGRSGWCAVAQTLVRESIRLRISGSFIAVVLVSLPLLPVFIDGASPLRYQIQTFMSRALDIAYVCAACMTLTLGCATVAFEIRDRQIWQLMTKPLDRFQYLLGKWLGLVGLNAVLFLICGVGIFVFVQWMRTRPAADEYDRIAVRDEVLTARDAARPVYERMTREKLEDAVDSAIASDAILKADLDSGRRRLEDVRREIATQRQAEFSSRQRRVDPGDGKTFVFSGLGPAKRLGGTVSLRYFLHAGASDSHSAYPIIFEFTDGSWVDRMFVPAQGHILTIPSKLIDDDGNLKVLVRNLRFDAKAGRFLPGDYTFNWDEDSLEVLYRVGGFEGNYLRGMVVNLVKLSFLAMLAVCSATFLNFSVACLLSFSIFLGGSLAPFLAQSLLYWTSGADAGSIESYIQYVVRAIAGVVEFVLRPFGQTSANDLLVKGRNVSWDRMTQAVAVIGLGWTGLVLVAGWLAFRRKELAIYSGQG
jgi:ABC-type transport system involved in multi-copper enzyme maturation permease subunit